MGLRRFDCIGRSRKHLCAGTFTGTVDFNPGAGVSNLASAADTGDIYLLKLSSDGSFVWARKFGGTEYDYGYTCALDGTGNIYLTGYFASDIFVGKVSSSGTVFWTNKIGSTSMDQGNSIAIDTSGNVYVIGEFRATVDFDPGVGVSNITSKGGADIFLMKYDSSGNIVWTKTIGETSQDNGKSVAVDSEGNIYYTGSYQGAVDFDPGVETDTKTSIGTGYSTYLTRINRNGTYAWTKTFGGTSWDCNGNSIKVNALGEILLGGNFSSTVDFDPGVGTNNITPNGIPNAYLSVFSTNGDYRWTRTFGNLNGEYVSYVLADASGKIYITGSYGGTVDFDPGAGTDSKISTGYGSAFLMKLGE